MQQSFKRTLAGVFLAIVLVIGAALVAKFALHSYDAYQLTRDLNQLHRIEPSPKHSPTDVVRFQLAALSRMDQPYPGAGVELVYTFLAPEQRDTLEGLGQLAALFTHPPFHYLVGFQSAEFDVARISGNHAQQLVQIQIRDDLHAFFVFLLTRQPEGDYADCWMTVGLLPIQVQVGEGAPSPAAEMPTPDE